MEQELERLCEADVLKLRSSGAGLHKVAMVERSAKAWPG
jgi:hypothetical protein